MNKFFDIKLIKFLLVGIINTLVGAVVMFGMYNIFGLGYWVSSASNYIVGGIVSYFLNKNFTFSNKEKSISQIFKFIFTLVICYIAAYGIAKPVVLKLLSEYSLVVRDNVAMLFGMAIYTVLNYVGQRFFAFKNQ